jgi:hypothetical protein
MSSPLSKKESKDKKRKKHRLHISIRPTDDGGFRADHSHVPHPDDESPVPSPEEHNLPDSESLADHVQQAYAPQTDEPEEGQAPPTGPSPQPTPAQGQV